jgi:hypothetical protein
MPDQLGLGEGDSPHPIYTSYKPNPSYVLYRRHIRGNGRYHVMGQLRRAYEIACSCQGSRFTFGLPAVYELWRFPCVRMVRPDNYFQQSKHIRLLFVNYVIGFFERWSV